MTLADWIGTIGVFQILLAFVLNILNYISKDHLAFILLNFIGAGLACLASVLVNFWPFVVLEAVWALFSLYALFKYLKKMI